MFRGRNAKVASRLESTCRLWAFLRHAALVMQTGGRRQVRLPDYNQGWTIVSEIRLLKCLQSCSFFFFFLLSVQSGLCKSSRLFLNLGFEVIRVRMLKDEAPKCRKINDVSLLFGHLFRKMNGCAQSFAELIPLQTPDYKKSNITGVMKHSGCFQEWLQ